VSGLTTAATVWVSAVAGILCGLGAWREAAIITVLVGVVLVVGGPIEKLLVDRYSADADEHPAPRSERPIGPSAERRVGVPDR
jgi:uncharacterized membrane protein YhiD involved in acid resistance